MSSKLECAVQGSYHPLEIIPFFRRWPCSPARDVLYTFIWSCGLGTAFCLVSIGLSGRWPSAHAFAVYLGVSNFIGYATHGVFVLGSWLRLDAWARAHGYLARVVYFTGVPIVGVIAGFWGASRVFPLGFDRWFSNPGWIASIASTSLVISMILAIILFWREREARAQAQYEHERLRAERVEREAILANLRALQAQIEPHFLFNTLANATSLVDSDAPKAKRMLESFIRFLRASLAATRAESTTLGAESELIAAYLDVLQVRMGARLRYTVDVAPELRGWSLAPMLLQPVVENAIRHGLEPKVEGGEIVVRARRGGGSVVIEIRDTGVGFAPTTRGGVGLANLRDRLRGLHGDRASLAIGDNPGGGTVVTIRLPE
jgi:signal transduction histidine kinase